MDLIQAQPGDSLPEILWTPASEHEVGYVRLLLGMKNFMGKQQKVLSKKLPCSS